MTLGDYLKKKGIRPSDFASTLGVPSSTVARWISGARKPRLNFLLQIQSVTKGSVRPTDFSPPAASAPAPADLQAVS